MAETDPDLQRILDAYQKDNEELRSRMKVLETQIASGETDVKVENEKLRRKVVELEAAINKMGEISKIQEVHEQYVKDTKQQELSLKEHIHTLQTENRDLQIELSASKLIWDNDEKQNESISKVVHSLRIAYQRKSGISEAIDSLAAIIHPDYLVIRERIPSPKKTPKSQSKLPPPSAKRNEELEQLKDEIENLKSQLIIANKKASQVQAIPKAPKVQALPPSNKQRELEKQVNDLQTQCDEQTKELQQLRNKIKERNNKNKELLNSLQQHQDEIIEIKRKNQIESSEKSIKMAEMESKLKILEKNNDYRSECETLKVRVASLEAENTELKKPKTSGNALVDRVIESIDNIESDIRKRQTTLSKWADELEEKWQDQMRAMEKVHKKEIEEKNEHIVHFREEFSKLSAELQMQPMKGKNKNV